MKQNVVALDIANHTGYAVYKDGEIIDYGAWDLTKHEKGEEPKTHQALADRVCEIVEKYNITHIVMEDAYFPSNDQDGKYKSYDAGKSLMRKHGVVLLYCEDHNITYSFVNPWRTKCFMFNAKKTMSRDILKRAMIVTVEGLGYELPAKHNDDVADAIGILCTHLGTFIRNKPNNAK